MMAVARAEEGEEQKGRVGRGWMYPGGTWVGSDWAMVWTLEAVAFSTSAIDALLAREQAVSGFRFLIGSGFHPEPTHQHTAHRFLIF